MHRIASIAFFFLASLGIAFAASSAQAPYGYVWANDPLAEFYRPDVSYASNAGGGGVQISRTGVGAYSVYFPGLNALGTDSGNVQVTTYGSGGERCKVLGWIGEIVNVLCFDIGGDPADAQFTALYTRAEDETTGVAYAWANQPSTEESYFANFNYAFNPGGGAVQVQRTGVGAYTVTFPGLALLGLDGGNVQVTAYGVGTAYCTVEGWGSDTVDARCFDIAGAPADSTFSVLYTKPVEATPDLFYVWANDANALAPYAPQSQYARDASGGPIEVERTGTGAYTVTFPGLDELSVEGGGHVQVTAYGSSSHTCAVEGWEVEAVGVGCFDVGGNQVDTRFSALIVAPEAGSFGSAIAALCALRAWSRRRPC